MYVIPGVTGHVGAVAARELLAAGAKVRVVVRSAEKGASWAQLGAEVAVASFDDEAALTAAFQGAAGAYLLVPPPVPPPADAEAFTAYQIATARRLAAAVKASGVGHVVLLSSVGAQHAEGTGPIKGLYHAERLLLETGAKLTAVRAAYFMENFGGLAQAIQGGMLPWFGDPNRPLSIVATVDIGRAVAQALQQPPAEAKAIVELAGPEDLTAGQIAETIGKVVGRSLNLIPIPVAGAVQAMLGNGLPQAYAEVFAEMYAGLEGGRLDWEGAAGPRRGSTTLAEQAQKLFA